MFYRLTGNRTTEKMAALFRKNPSVFFGLIDSPAHPNCQYFRNHFPRVTKPDGDMDIAFTIVVHKDVEQIARLLRMIHRVNNYYCIHLDYRSGKFFEEALTGVAKCFGPNVELVPKEERAIVNWGDESVLKPQFTCGKQALNRHLTWRYLLNIVGQEFPLKTNLEIQAALKALNGSNMIESFNIDRFKRWVMNRTLPYDVSYDFLV